MAVQISTRVWQDSQHEGTAQVVMLALANYANEDGVAWPGVARLARDTRRSRRWTQRTLRKLEQSGEVIVAEGKGRSNTNMYYVTLGFSRAEMVETMTKRLGFSHQDADAKAVLVLETREKGGVEAALSSSGGVASSTGKGGAQCSTEKERVAHSDTKGGVGATQPVMNHQEKKENRHEPLDSLSGKRATKPKTEKQQLHDDMAYAIVALCEYDSAAMTEKAWKKVHQTAKKLIEAGVVPQELVGTAHVKTDSFSFWWFLHEWRGKQGQPPQPSQIRDTWGQYKAWCEKRKQAPEATVYT